MEHLRLSTFDFGFDEALGRAPPMRPCRAGATPGRCLSNRKSKI
jgi:hypothetical protein